MDKGVWYEEKWYDEDLEGALAAGGIPITKENVEKLKESCKGIFEDHTERNEMLAEKAREVFGSLLSPEEVIEQLVSLKENSESFLDKEEPNSVWEKDIRALNQAIEYARKEIPQKAIADGDDDMDFLRCPKCNAYAGTVDSLQADHLKRCERCGQSLLY